MRNRVGILLALALVAGACSGSDSGATTDPAPLVPTESPVSPADRPAAPTTLPIGPGPTSPSPDISAEPVAGGAGIGDWYYRGLGNTGYDVEHYLLELDFDPVTDRLVARATITAVAVDALVAFNLDFDGLTIDNLSVDGADAEFSLAGEELTIVPADPISAGARFTVAVEYSGVPRPDPYPTSYYSMGWINTESNQAFVVAVPDGAHTWFPCNDHPLDKATYEFRVTVPSGFTAAANGTLISSRLTADGDTVWIWEMDDPMATHLATVVIGEFDIVVDELATADAGVLIRHVLPRGATLSDWPDLAAQGVMLAFLAELFGPYPFDVYGIAIVDELGFANETQTLSLVGPPMTGPALERVLIHELAHQWFGDSVSPAQWKDVWLNEGFATYAEWLWIEREAGASFLQASIEAERAQFATFDLPPAGMPPLTDLFNPSVYRVGAMTLHALRLTVGDDHFFEILRSYHRQFQGSAATTEDFIAVAEAISGEDLDDLFDAWLFGSVPQFP